LSTPARAQGSLAPDRRRSEAVRRTALKVFVRGLRIDARIGVHAHERGRLQPLIIDVEMEVEDRRIEGIADTVDYEEVAGWARRTAEVGHVDLVEHYADRLGQACLDDPRVRSVRVRVEKPEALRGAQAAGCEATFVRD
jgi:7,8-dihydroneopterin aldolase/epimerase/oxygenase